ncbi:MAG: hypothetical protein ABJN95_14540 [Maribacter sp.]|uniref:hypothetical protein n=1 Tax=Maribacter sp. TaxID=1897614 RepID=UPI0032970D1B
MKLPLPLRVGITAVVTLMVWAHIGWDYFHEGIPTHYLLHDKDLPGIPNWLGGLVLPFFTWFLLYRIHKRIDESKSSSESLQLVILRFLLAMGVAIALSVFYTLDISLIDYIMPTIFILAFIFPLYKSEYLLGWVLGSSFTFGAIIPIGFGSLFALVFFMFYRVPRGVFNYFKLRKG